MQQKSELFLPGQEGDPEAFHLGEAGTALLELLLFGRGAGGVGGSGHPFPHSAGQHQLLLG
jgi:hypothetical protein